MNHYPLLALAGMAIASPMAHAANGDSHGNGKKKPMNIIYIMCDDHSYQTISAYDNRLTQTPQHRLDSQPWRAVYRELRGQLALGAIESLPAHGQA